ncbi:DUF4190 domain-containing protein [Bacillus spongiae]|uniref:DUF4190 domain-containing protein n=1 Tax=Bacillus spongiae TaxID=2683610 RepID=A0ABU8HGF7_9BACI
MNLVENTQTNNQSTLALTLGILSIIIPFIGLLIGIAGVFVSRKAINEIVHTNEGGKGLATAGFICSIMGIFIQILVILGYIAFTSITYTG